MCAILTLVMYSSVFKSRSTFSLPPPTQKSQASLPLELGMLEAASLLVLLLLLTELLLLLPLLRRRPPPPTTTTTTTTTTTAAASACTIPTA